MEMDSSCLFNNIGGCGGTATPCYYLCKPTIITDNNSTLLGCKSKIESLLLQYGKFDLLPFNVEEFHVCDNHDNLIQSSILKNCCLCKPFGRSKSSKSGLRTISKLYAFAAWKKNAIRLSFGRKMCTVCRNDLEKYITKEIREECDELCQWLYDVNFTHTPSISSSNSHNVLSQSFNKLVVHEKQDCLKQFLQGNLKTVRIMCIKIICFSSFVEVNYDGPVPTTKSFVKLQPSSKKRFCRQSTNVLKHILGIMSPNDDTNVIWQTNIENSTQISLSNGNLDKNLRLILTSLAEAYNAASHWTVRQQILSIMANDVTFSTILMFIPNLTEYRYYRARRYAKSTGKGVVVDDTRTPTIRYEDYQLEHFIEFIVSPHICTDLPFGQKELHLSTGETILIPLTIRNLAPQRIITQYYNYCKEYYSNTFRPLGQSSLFSILNQCTASTRRSLQGLDSFSAEGSTAFDFLISIVDGLSTLGLPSNSAAELKRDLQDSRNYLKSDYKVHISRNNPVPDHCSVYALSDAADKCWYQACDHNHDQQCDQCELLKITLAKIRKYIEEYQSDVAMRDRLLYRVQQQIRCIEDWKAHLLRTIHQDQSRIAILNNLDDETIMIHVDWAMKWLPVKYRESTVSFHMQRCTEIEPLGIGLRGSGQSRVDHWLCVKDHFAKRGLSWHIAYVIRKTSSRSSNSPNTSFDSTEVANQHSSNDDIFQHKIFCHVFDQCVQNAKTVVSIIRHIFLCLRQTAPNIKYAHLRSDNAGCYHGCETLLSVEQLFKDTGIWIRSIDFSDPQSGKGPCDRIAAVIKCLIRRFIDEKHNCTNAIEFLKASERTKGVEFYASEVQNIHNEKIEWKGVKQINNIEYIQRQTTSSTKKSTELRVWQYWKVGPGKLYRLCDLQKNNVKINPLNVFFSTNVSVPWVNDYYEKADKDYPNDTYSDAGSSSEELSEDESNVKNASEDHCYAFDCQVNGCVARYRYYANLLRHYTTGKHKMKLEKHSLIDKSKILFHQSLTTNHLRSTPLLSITVVSPVNSSTIPPLTQHWASQKNKPN
ncbi:unnamed protein product, partial [Rotaria sp. Silwood2]